jgi:hypothetical protein
MAVEGALRLSEVIEGGYEDLIVHLEFPFQNIVICPPHSIVELIGGNVE